MDPLSLTASVVALIGLSDQIITACKGYVTALKDAPNDLCNILIEVGSVKCTLETLEMRQTLSPILQKIEIVHSPLEGCRRELDALAQLLPVEAEGSRKRKRGKSIFSYAELAWPFKQGKARKILENLGRHKGTLVLILTSDAGQDIRSIKDNVEEIVCTLTDQQRDSVLRWLAKTDPASNHNRACQLQETHTGQWLFRSTDYNEWISGQARHLWLHGIPGAGKTILASFIIQDVKRFCESSGLGDLGWAYYYCYFGRNQDESHDFLCWIINQLCRQLKYVPQKLVSLKNLAAAPSLSDLLDILSTVVKKFRRVYIIVDALDESQDRRFILDLLVKIVGDDAFQNISLLTTSRKELDILQAFEGVCSSISLSNPLVDEDICTYVESQLQTDRKFSRWPVSLRTEIRNALTEGAKGMFRWAACQLDILGRLNSVTDIRKALKDLPKTLEDTYERILMGIDPLNRSIAHKALQLIAVEHMPELAEVAEAAVVDIDRCLFTTDNRLIHPTALLEICSCLITADENGVLDFAHYTVMEYLTSQRIQDGPAAMFKVSTDEANILAAKARIIYLLNLPYDHLPSAKELFSLDKDGRSSLEQQIRQEYPFIYEAVLDWDQYLERSEILSNGSLTELVLRLLDPQEPHFEGFEEYNTMFHLFDGDFFFRIKCQPGTQPGTQSSIALAYLCKADLVGIAEDLLKRSFDSPILQTRLEQSSEFQEHFKFLVDVEGTSLQVAAMMRKTEMVKLLIRYGADVNACYGGWTILTSTLRTKANPNTSLTNNYEEIIGLLLDAGASSNPSGVCKTPLQLAVELDHDVAVVRLLLAAGAMVNAVGSKEAVAMNLEPRPATTLTIFDSASLESYNDTPLLMVEKKRKALKVGTRRYEAKSSRLAFVHRLLTTPSYIEKHCI